MFSCLPDNLPILQNWGIADEQTHKRKCEGQEGSLARLIHVLAEIATCLASSASQLRGLLSSFHRCLIGD